MFARPALIPKDSLSTRVIAAVAATVSIEGEAAAAKRACCARDGSAESAGRRGGDVSFVAKAMKQEWTE